jgi:glycosyltransferase involved in cell wall biosynthesis
MTLSIIVPVFNAEAYLGRCLRSLLDQDLDPSDYEVVVINDGSDDGSRAIAESLAVTNQNIVIRSQENQGISAARNAGIDLAKGKYIYFVDADDHVASQSLGGLIKLMDRENLQVLGFGFADVLPDEYVPVPRFQCDALQRVDVTPGSDYMATHAYPNTVWWYMVDRTFLMGLGVRFEVGRLVEDAIFTANVISAATRFAFVPMDVYRYGHRSGSVIRTRTDESAKRLVADYERVVFGLDELRRRLLKTGKASPAVLDRLVNRQQAFVFFLIARLMRSNLPARPILPDALERIRAIDMYPMRRFPGPDDDDVRYKFLTVVYNRGYLLYPCIYIYRWLRAVRRHGPR